MLKQSEHCRPNCLIIIIRSLLATGTVVVTVTLQAGISRQLRLMALRASGLMIHLPKIGTIEVRIICLHRGLGVLAVAERVLAGKCVEILQATGGVGSIITLRSWQWIGQLVTLDTLDRNKVSCMVEMGKLHLFFTAILDGIPIYLVQGRLVFALRDVNAVTLQALSGSTGLDTIAKAEVCRQHQLGVFTNSRLLRRRGVHQRVEPVPQQWIRMPT